MYRNAIVPSGFTALFVSLIFVLLLLLLTQFSLTDNDLMNTAVYGDLEEIHGDDDLMENRMIIPLHADGMTPTDAALSPQPSLQASATGAGDAAQLDKLGVKKIYSSKVNGQKWFLGDPGLITGGVGLKKQPVGKPYYSSYLVESTQVRFRVPPPSSGYHPDQITTFDQSKLQSKGYMQSPTDWKNVEITGRFLVKSYTDSTVNGAAHIALSTRGGTHTSSAPCEGTAYWANMYVTGRSKFEKELQHTAGYTTTNPQKTNAVGPLQDKWIGVKHMIYTLPSGAVKQEHWYQEYVGEKWTEWKKIFENTDSGSWGGGNPNCGGTDKTIMRWGGPLVFFRWDNIDAMYVKQLSIREIVPP